MGTTVWTANTTPAWRGPGRTVPAKGFQGRMTTQAGLKASLGTSRPTGGKIMFGSAKGPSMSTTVSALKPQCIRIYENRGVTPSTHTWAACAGSAVPAGLAVLYSCDPGVATLAVRDMTKGTAYFNMITAWRAILAGAPDDGTVLHHIMCHEPFGKSFTAAQWASATVNWKADVVDYVNDPTRRTNPWVFNICGQGSYLDTAGGTATARTYFTAAACKAADIVTFDCYQGTQVTETAAFAAGVGKPWAIPEYGGPGVAGGTDAQMLTFMKSFTPPMSKMTVPPLWVAWFNNFGTEITGGTTPQSEAYWLGVDTA